MKIFVPQLKQNDSLAFFFGYNSENGWLEYRDSTIFNKIFVLDDLAFCEEVKSRHSNEHDLVLEEEDLISAYAKIQSIDDAKDLIDNISERIVHGGHC